MRPRFINDKLDDDIRALLNGVAAKEVYVKESEKRIRGPQISDHRNVVMYLAAVTDMHDFEQEARSYLMNEASSSAQHENVAWHVEAEQQRCFRPLVPIISTFAFIPLLFALVTDDAIARSIRPRSGVLGVDASAGRGNGGQALCDGGAVVPHSRCARQALILVHTHSHVLHLGFLRLHCNQHS